MANAKTLRDRSHIHWAADCNLAASCSGFDRRNAMDIRWMMDLNVLSDTQRSAGTLLSATLLEVIGLEPMIVTVLIYTFVCWSTDANANQRRPALFVETTVIGVATLQPAVNVASQRGEGELA